MPFNHSNPWTYILQCESTVWNAATRECWNQIHLHVDTQCEVTWRSITFAPWDSEQPSRAARVTQRRAATVSLITAERIAVLFTGCECEILGLRLMTSQQLNWIYALVFSGDELRRKAELFDQLPCPVRCMYAAVSSSARRTTPGRYHGKIHATFLRALEMSEDSLNGRCYLYSWCFMSWFTCNCFILHRRNAYNSSGYVQMTTCI